MAESKNKRTGKLLLAEIGCILLVCAGMAGLYFTGVVKQGSDDLLSHFIFVLFGIVIVGYGLRKGVLAKELDYDNGEHPGRFLVCFVIGIVIAFACVFLPVGAWPFMPIYMAFSLFGSLPLGVLGATALLVLPVTLTEAGLAAFLIYLISGFLVVMLFYKMQSGFSMGLPFVLSLMGLFVCETAGTVLVMNARPDTESFVIPTINVIVSGILMLGILQYFSGKVLYQYRENYLDLNDPENDVLGALKQTDRNAYKKSIHTAYFCERIGAKLGMDTDALKCAGYYHGLGDALEMIHEMHPFPPSAWAILEEYHGKGQSILRKETAVLMVSENIVGMIIALIQKAEGAKLDYDKIINAVFKRYQDAGTFKNCNISMQEFFTMQKIFKEEKLYYDFLR